ncbi:nuclear transport factor 2 family protein [Cesiribacter sp. SM1]|uniref:nuclear transport factor 2 family protein n=1 Tax=Cesiribacter sp. SM1 TaxID=2861196 RepID=UPI001CD2ECF7|nr:nuclear transport factor 2 family protein [Cesiribacter sp. SM1]
MTNKEIALTINQAVQTADVETAAALVAENYIQHTPVIPDGRKGFKMFLTKIKNNEIPAPKLKTVRVIEDGNFVALHHEAHWPNRKAMFEIFRFEDGLAAEHWSAMMDHPENTASGNRMFDGATEIMDLDKTDTNKEIIKTLMNEVFMKGNFDKSLILGFYHPEVIQHNPFIDNTVDGLIDRVSQLQEQGIKIQIEHLHCLLAQGNFVLAFSEGKFGNDGVKPTAFFDLFRLENGRIMEHWGIVQEVPDTMTHDNGMFRLPLYKRLGGYDGIAAYIDHAFPQVAAHPDLQHLFLGHSMATKMRQRQLIIDKLSSSLKGPTIYLGKPLKEIHQGLNITLPQWESFMAIINKAMDERGIKGETKKDFIDHFESYRSVTVEAELESV